MGIDTTFGASTANSYVTEDEADVYMENRAFVSSTWSNYTSLEKEQRLITASLTLDWYANWKGYKVSEAQGLCWPRSDVLRRSGEEVLETEIPPEVKIAVYEMAISSFDGDRTVDDPLSGIGLLRLSSLMIKAGPEKPNQTDKKVLPEKVKKIIKDLIVSYGGSIPLLRM